MSLTRLLNDWAEGKEGAADRLLPVVLPELRGLARIHLARERPHHTLQPTEILNEVFLKLVSSRLVGFDSRSHFFAFASRLIREILVEHARARGRRKRGAEYEHLPVDEVADWGATQGFDPDRTLAIDQGLKKLRRADPRLSQVAEMRFFGGLTMPEIGQAMGLSLATVERLWSVARLRLGRYLRGGSAESATS